MAQKVVIELSDDLDGSEAVETITFALDGRSYEIDLSEKNAGRLRKIFAPYAEAGRRQGGARRGAKRIPAGADRPNPVEVRTWAAAHGIEVAPRGRVPAEVVEKYRAANG
nr:Lsr2 family protein [Streptomyces sp. 846.5]